MKGGRALSLVTLTRNGEVRIPKAVRDALHLEVGDQLEFRVRDDGVVEIRKRDVDLVDLVGVVTPRRRGVAVEQMNREIAEAASGGGRRPAQRPGARGRRK